MQASFILSTTSEFLPMGTLEKLESFGAQFEQARGLPGNLPVLTCPISEKEKHLLESMGGKSNLGFGCINLADGSKLHTIRFQMGGLQFYWVADMVDPEVWAAIDMWRTVGRMPLLFRIENGEDWGAKFGVISGPTGTLSNEVFRRGGNPEPSATTVTQLLRLVSSGILEAEATTDIEGVPLRHVFVNALVTMRVSQFIDQSKVVGPGERKKI
ncbi:hypothetical protein BJN34_22085 [Cupriavidus necator]|uniref:Uncharacterized protein n=1 Tax=Cupriavidus necator TaxID=106590 RepID=A0A1U9UVG1_CUPNE|nr:hypothetical protein [Cupriavidus necator]AQV96559.1 hypothetical protein BJN34_22085 [Cupriavidus necator]